MDSMIYNPQKEYDGKLRQLHLENTQKQLDELVRQSGVDVEQNRATVANYNVFKESVTKLRKKRNLWRVLRIVMIVTLILIPLVILKITPKIRQLKSELESADKKASELLAEAQAQMAPLNALFTDRDALDIIEKTIPLLSFSAGFSAEQETDMILNYDFDDVNSSEQSTVDLLAGRYNENPFLFETKLTHRMGVETYHGYKTIYWTETHRDSDGKLTTETHSETLHATVVKPKPYYSTKVMLDYCSQAAPKLCFSRDATHLERKSEKGIDKYVKKGEKKLKKKTKKALKKNQDFMSMSNTEFEVLFDALDRTDEVEFRTLFTPLAQTNMVDLIRSETSWGDDFNFIKRRRTNRIITQHSQGRTLNLLPDDYYSYSFDMIKESFTRKNAQFFKAMYFDFAPIWAIPAYQERPAQSLNPIPESYQRYSAKECEALANLASKSYTAHPRSQTKAILRAALVGRKGDVDQICVTAYSYDIFPRIDFVPVHGGDGRWHDVPVPWDDYIPLEATNNFFVSDEENALDRTVVARRNDLCMFI